MASMEFPKRRSVLKRSGRESDGERTRTIGQARRSTVLAVALLFVVIPFLGIGSAGPVADVVDEVNAVVCDVEETQDLLCGVQRLWVERYAKPGAPVNSAQAVDVSPDGSRVFVTGFSAIGGSTPDGEGGVDDHSQVYSTVAYDAGSGEELWNASFNGPNDRADLPTALTVSPDGAFVYVTGHSAHTGTGTDFGTVAYDAEDGTQIWYQIYNGPGGWRDIAWDVHVSPDGTMVYVSGHSWDGQYDYATIAYDAADGEKLWLARYNGPDHECGPMSICDHAFALAVDPDGSSVYVTGRTRAESNEFATLAYDAQTGEGLWVARYNGPVGATDGAIDIGVSPDGSRVFATGYSAGTGSGLDYMTISYDAGTGEEIWSSRYDGPAGNTDMPYALEVSHDGSMVFATGSSTGQGTVEDYATVAYDAATGEELWVARYNGPDDLRDIAQGLGVAPDGSRVYVTGYSWGDDTAFDYTTVVYDATSGEEIWVDRYDGPGEGNDYGQALVVSPDGSRFFVTGSSTGEETYDFLTIAYDAQSNLGVQINGCPVLDPCLPV